MKKNCAPSWLLKDYTEMHGQQNIKFSIYLICDFLSWGSAILFVEVLFVPFEIQ
jgi:hypothetical protein